MTRYGWRIAFATSGTLVGLSIFFVFGFHYHALLTAAFGGVSGLLACITLLVHIHRRRCDKYEWPPHDYFAPMVSAGIAGTAAGILGFILALTMAMRNHEKPGVASDYVASVWCLMTVKWGVLLLVYADEYRRQDQESRIRNGLLSD
eukprot:m.154025 g.154025  ORF g.154025 m.154025 type:complete len:147 (+) comp16951_c0_seq3:377-817(+)